MWGKTPKRALVANGILAGAAVFFAGLLVYALMRSHLHSSTATFLYAALSLIGAGGYAYALRLPVTKKLNWALATLSSAGAIFSIEIVLAFLLLRQPSDSLLKQRSEAARRAGLPFDTRTTRQVLDHLRAQGIDAQPNITPKMLLDQGGLPGQGDAQMLPLGGIAGATTILCNESGSYVTYVADEHGFNNPPGLYQPGKLELALVGDSFTQGFCVDPGQDVTARLRDCGYAALNFGMAGNGPLLALASLIEYAAPLRPQIVLWLYYENDLEDLIEEWRSPLLQRYLDGSFRQRLLERQPEIRPALVDFVNAELQQQAGASASQLAPGSNHFAAKLPEFATLGHLRSVLGLREQPLQATLPRFSHILERAKITVESWGGRLYFVYLPGWSKYANDSASPLRQQVIAIAREQQLPIIDFDRVLSAHADPLSLFPFRLHGHYTAEGYYMLAQYIDEQLRH